MVLKKYRYILYIDSKYEVLKYIYIEIEFWKYLQVIKKYIKYFNCSKHLTVITYQNKIFNNKNDRGLDVENSNY